MQPIKKQVGNISKCRLKKKKELKKKIELRKKIELKK